jgi:hypothetical protein
MGKRRVMNLRGADACGTNMRPSASSALKGRYTWRAVAMDCRYAAPAGLNLVDDSIPRAVPWADELPRLQRSAASGIRDTSRRKSPPRVKGLHPPDGRSGKRSRNPYGADLRPAEPPGLESSCRNGMVRGLCIPPLLVLPPEAGALLGQMTPVRQWRYRIR